MSKNQNNCLDCLKVLNPNVNTIIIIKCSFFSFNLELNCRGCPPSPQKKKKTTSAKS